MSTVGCENLGFFFGILRGDDDGGDGCLPCRRRHVLAVGPIQRLSNSDLSL